MTRSTAAARRPNAAAARNNVSAASRDLLLQAAARLMVRKETIDVSLSEIAAESGLNAALVKYYFGGKQGLMRALLDDVIGQNLHHMDKLLDRDISSIEKLKAHVVAIARLHYKFPFYTRLVSMMFQDESLGPDIAANIFRPVADAQKRLIEQGVRENVFKPIDPMFFYFLVFGMCENLFFNQGALRFGYGIAGIDDDLFQRYANTLVDFVMGGVLTPEAARAL